jgi:hypothetical protein
MPSGALQNLRHIIDRVERRKVGTASFVYCRTGKVEGQPSVTARNANPQTTEISSRFAGKGQLFFASGST